MSSQLSIRKITRLRAVPVVSLTLALLLAAPSAATAEQPRPNTDQFQPSRVEAAEVSFESREYTVDGITYAEAESTALMRPAIAPVWNTGPTTNAIYNGSSGTWAWQFKNVLSWSSSQVHHYYAWSKKTSGSGTYATHAHASLNIWDAGSGWYDPIEYGGCMWVDQTNATSQTCGSAWQSWSSGDKWQSAAGFKFDVGADGVNVHECSACIDVVKQF